MACTDIASGTLVSLTYTEESTCGIRPVGMAGLSGTISTDKSGAGTDEFDLDRTAGDFADDDVLPDQILLFSAWTATAINIAWRVKSVTALKIILYDTDGVGVDEVAGAGAAKITLSTLRATGRQLDLTRDTLESEEVRPTRQFADVRHGFNQVEGSPGYELSLISYDDMLRGAMSGDWETPIPVTGQDMTAATPQAGQATIGNTTGAYANGGYRPGDLIITTLFPDGANNKVWRILSSDGDEIVVDDPDNDAITDGTSAGVASFIGERIDIGLNLRTFTFEQRFDDILQYREYNGCAINDMSWSITPESIVGGTFGILGMRAESMGSSIIVESPQPAPLTTPFAAFDGRLYEGGVQNFVVTSVEFTVENNRTLEAVVGSKFSPGVFEGRCGVSGTLTAMLRGSSLYNKFVDETDSQLYIKLQEPADPTAFINVVMPRIKYTSSDMDPPIEGPVPLNMAFRALETTVEGVGENVSVATSLTIQKSNLRV